MPTINPAAKELKPTIKVSIVNINDTFFLLMPNSKYVPNSFFLLFIINPFAYTIKKPNTIEMKIDNTLIAFPKKSMSCL